MATSALQHACSPSQVQASISHSTTASPSGKHCGRAELAAPAHSSQPRSVQACARRSHRQYRSRLRPARCNEHGSQPETQTQDQPDAEPRARQGLSTSAGLFLIKVYQEGISPLIPRSCRFVPSCSEYTRQAVLKFGVPKAAVLMTWRIVRCNPWGGSGYDPPCWPPPRSLRHPQT